MCSYFEVNPIAMYFNLHSKSLIQLVCTYHIEIPQVANENAIILVHYFVQHKTVLSCIILWMG